MKTLEEKKQQFNNLLDNYFYERSRGGQVFWSTTLKKVQHDEIWDFIEQAVREAQKEIIEDIKEQWFTDSSMIKIEQDGKEDEYVSLEDYLKSKYLTNHEESKE